MWLDPNYISTEQLATFLLFTARASIGKTIGTGMGHEEIHVWLRNKASIIFGKDMLSDTWETFYVYMTEHLKKLEELQIIEIAHHRSMCLELHNLLSKNHGDNVVTNAVHRVFLQTLHSDDKKNVHITLALMKNGFEKAMHEIVMNSAFNKDATKRGKGCFSPR